MNPLNLKYGMLILVMAGCMMACSQSQESAAAESTSDSDQHVSSASLIELSERIHAEEMAIPDLRPDNHARIIWADSLNPEVTSYSFVYLHGFGASYAEGDPVHLTLANHFGANLFLPRLKGHGLTTEREFSKLTAEKLIASAEEALHVGRTIGEKVIIIGNSTGGALATLLASKHDDIEALLLFAPIFSAGDQLMATLATGAKQQFIESTGSAVITVNRRDGPEADYWSSAYHFNGYRSLAELVTEYMIDSTFEQIELPLFLGYYYKNEEEKDQVVSVQAMRDMFELIQTPDHKSMQVAFPDAADHVISSRHRSGSIGQVIAETKAFLENVLGDSE